LVESLLNLSEVAPAEVFISIRSLFRSPLDVCPDVLACTLALARPRGATLQEELLAQLAPAFLPPPASYDSRSGVVGSPASLHAVLVRLWQLSPGFLVRAALRAHIDDRAFAARALDIAVAMRVVLGTAAADPLAALLDVKLAALSADVKPYLAFALDVATLASRREVALPGTPLSSPPTLALEAWLRRRLHENGNLFALACIDFLRENMTRAQQSAVTGRPAVNVCAPETVVVFFKVLFAAQGLLSPELQNELSVFFGACAQANPQLLATAAAQQQQSQMQPPALVQPTQMQAPVPAAAPAAAPAGSVSEVEDEANSYFQKLYTSAVSIDEAVSMLKRFQQSGVVREREVFACMIHNLFDEFQFFAKYPEKELKITATLMGALLSNQMLLPSAALPAAPIPTVLQAAVSSPLSASSGSVSLHLGLALRCVLEALRKPADSKLFRFGKWALEGCEKRLGDWPPFCALLMPLAHLHAVYPQLVELLNRGMLQAQAVDPASMALLSATLSCPFEVFQQTMISGTAWSPSQSSKAANAAAAAVVQAVVNNVPTLARPSEAEPKEVSNGLPVYVKPPAPPLPDEATQDRLTFLINSLGKNNVETKARELRSFIKPEHLYFLAHDLMFKRVSVETNLHALYLTFLDAIKMDELRDHLIDAVQSSIRALLSSDKILQSMGERTLLKVLLARCWLRLHFCC
jgi:CCR4-NOT transcription complex subunit 1